MTIILSHILTPPYHCPHPTLTPAFVPAATGYLKDQGRTRVLVTNQVALVLPHADLVVCLDGYGGVAAACAPGNTPLHMIHLNPLITYPLVTYSLTTHPLATSFVMIHPFTPLTPLILRQRPLVLSYSGDLAANLSTTIASSSSASEKMPANNNNNNNNNNGTILREGVTLNPLANISTNSIATLDSATASTTTNDKKVGFFELLSALRLDKTVIADDASTNSNGNHRNNKKNDDDEKNTTTTTTNNNNNRLDNHQEITAPGGDTTEGNTTLPTAKVGQTPTTKTKAKLLVEKETKSTGTVPLRVYWFYFMSGGGLGAMVLVFLSNIALPSAWFFQNWSLGTCMSHSDLWFMM